MNPASSSEKRVRFSDDSDQQVHEFEAVGQDDHRMIWYQSQELENLRKADIHRVQQCSQVDEVTSTWRGLENLREGWSRQEKSRQYVRAILRTIGQQHKQSCDGSLPFEYYQHAAEAVRGMARMMHKVEDHRVLFLAAKDADAAMPAVVEATQHHFSVSPVRSLERESLHHHRMRMRRSCRRPTLQTSVAA